MMRFNRKPRGGVGFQRSFRGGLRPDGTLRVPSAIRRPYEWVQHGHV